MEITVESQSPRQVVDITDQIQNALPTGAQLCVVNAQHTTCALTTADLDPGTDQDLLDFLAAITPDKKWRHSHNPEHAPAHLLASIIGPSCALSIEDGRLQLGNWQRLVLVELDGPRQRKVNLIFL